MNKQLINRAALAMLVRRKRFQDRLGGAQFERQTGISKSTLSRVESGKGDVLNAENFLRLMLWLGVDPRTYVSYVAKTATLDQLLILIAGDSELTKEGRELVMTAVTTLYHTLGKAKGLK